MRKSRISKLTSVRPKFVIAAFALALLLGIGTAPLIGHAQSKPVTLVVIAAEPKEKTIKFGDPLDIRITIQNQGKKTITVPAKALSLKNKGLDSWGQVGGFDESVVILPESNPDRRFTLKPGDSVVMSGRMQTASVSSIGPIRAPCVIQTQDKDLIRQLDGRNEIPASVKVSATNWEPQGLQSTVDPKDFYFFFNVGPSDIINSAWSAKSDGDLNKLKVEFERTILINSQGNDWPKHSYIEKSLIFMGCYALPVLKLAMKSPDAAVRKRAIYTIAGADWNARELNTILADPEATMGIQRWTANVAKCDEDRTLRESIKLIVDSLSDQDSGVRVSAISTLSEEAVTEKLGRSGQNSNEKNNDPLGLVRQALPAIQKLVTDSDPNVRSAAQGFLINFISEQSVADNFLGALSDPDRNVRIHTLSALQTSGELPPKATLEKAFVSARGEIGQGLAELMFEQEDSELSARLTPAFAERTADERLMIITLIAGHNDKAALGLVELGLKDTDAGVCRAALSRLLEFPASQALSLCKENKQHLPSSVQSVAIAVEKELQTRTSFPFFASSNGQSVEAIFPSKNGTEPMVSPDGKLIAYVETGWGRPGGSGGQGRSNLLSITHVVRSDGTNDRVVSDMFLVGWMSDSQRLASARDGFATIVDVDGKTTDEFGSRFEKPKSDSFFTRSSGVGKWPTGEIREQFGVEMPHSKQIQNSNSEDGAASPDGKWFGPRIVNDKWQFENVKGDIIALNMIEDVRFHGSRSFWSPDGEHVIIFPLEPNYAGGHHEGVIQEKALIVDISKRSVASILDVDQVPNFGQWDYRKARFNPWSKDGKHLTFVRNGQVWVSNADGTNPKQITFDKINKVFATFSPDGTKIAYVAFQFTRRGGYERLGLTNLWIVDATTGLAAKITRPAPGKIQGIDWLDNDKLIFDRISNHPGFAGSGSTLRTISLK